MAEASREPSWLGGRPKERLMDGQATPSTPSGNPRLTKAKSAMASSMSAVRCHACPARFFGSADREPGSTHPTHDAIPGRMAARGAGLRGLTSKGHDLVPDPDPGVPGDVDGPLYALVRRAALRVQRQRPLGRLAAVRGHRELVVHVDGLDPDRLADTDDAAFHGGGVTVTVEPDLAPCQGAAQRAVHSAGDGRDDVVEGGGDRGALRDAVVLAQLALYPVDHRGGHLAEISVTVAVPVLEAGLGDVFEVDGHGGLLGLVGHGQAGARFA